LGLDELSAGTVEGAVIGGVFAAEFGELVVVAVEGADVAGGVLLIGGTAVGFHFAPPHLVVGGVETFDPPGHLDDFVEEDALVSGGGGEVAVVAVAESVEIVAVFAFDDDGVGVDGGLEGVAAGGGFAGGGAGAGGFFGVGSVGSELFF
jgi:hypothetical protein